MVDSRSSLAHPPPPHPPLGAVAAVHTAAAPAVHAPLTATPVLVVVVVEVALVPLPPLGALYAVCGPARRHRHTSVRHVRARCPGATRVAAATQEAVPRTATTAQVVALLAATCMCAVAGVPRRRLTTTTATITITMAMAKRSTGHILLARACTL